MQPSKTATRRAFGLGVASADPQPNAILLWSRVDPLPDERDIARVIVQMSTARDFNRIVVEKEVTGRPDHDFTLRLFVSDLQPNTTYYYRFIASDGAVSRTGRTWTAPSDTEDKALTIALASCQTYPPSQYGAYRHLINQEKATGQRPDFVLHVGDYIYGVGDILPVDPQTGLSGPPPQGYGLPKSIIGRSRPLTGGAANEAALAEETDFDKLLAGRRRIYHAYHRDMDLQDARALFPFVCSWDDHEFGNDVWQSYDGKPNAVGRLAATQAWYEFVPQILSESRTISDIKTHAKDFEDPGQIQNSDFSEFDDDFFATNSDNAKAINAMTSYRSISWGQRADIIVTDTRSYRGPSANPSLSLDAIRNNQKYEAAFGGFTLYEGEVLFTLAKGKHAKGGNPPDQIQVNGQTIANPRRDAPEVSMLGEKQKKWLKASLQKSIATWKVWAVASPTLNFRFDPEKVSPGTGYGYNWTDDWDGYPNEREELLDFIWNQKIGNVISLSGDRHAHYAGVSVNRLESASPRQVLPEFVGTGISAFPRWKNMARAMKKLGIDKLCRTEIDGRTVTTFDMMMTKGSRAVAKALASPDGDFESLLAGDPVLNPHLLYADNDAHGYVIAKFGSDHVSVDFVTVPNQSNWKPDQSPNGPASRRVVSFKLPAWPGGTTPTMSRTHFDGEPLFDVI
ncbi:MAG: hypothetical protein Hens3KO_13790 [Henriciella sp.]